jgi:inner membrane protein
MLWKTHLAFGILAGILGLNYYTPNNHYIFFTIILIASILPDIDHTRSKISSKIPIIPSLLQFLTKHRGIFHSLPFAVFLAIVINYYNRESAIGFLIGYLSHLLADSLTISGINFLHPFSQLRLKGFIKTGGLLEVFLFLVILTLILKLILF